MPRALAQPPEVATQEIISEGLRRGSRRSARVLSRLVGVIEELVPDGLGERIIPLLPSPKPRRSRCPGRRPIEDRAAPTGIVFVPETGITWNQLPTSLVGCSGALLAAAAGLDRGRVWPALHELLLAELRGARVRGTGESADGGVNPLSITGADMHQLGSRPD